MFDLSKALNKQAESPESRESPNLSNSLLGEPLTMVPQSLGLDTPVKLGSIPNDSATSSITGDLGLLDSLPTEPTMSYKDQIASVPSLDELAEEFQNPDQPELFNDKALSAIHQACQTLEESIDNANEVKSQLTFIMTELRKYPDVAAKVCDSDISTMVKALRHSYNLVAFAKQTNRKAKAEKQAKVNDLIAEADASGLFDGLDL